MTHQWHITFDAGLGYTVFTEPDADAVLTRITPQLDADDTEIFITAPDGHRMDLLLNPLHGKLVFYPPDDTMGISTYSAAMGTGPDVVFKIAGNHVDAPSTTVLSRREAITIFQHFITTQRPADWIDWR
ncbi:MAG: hypothetical protein AAFU54_18435 [Chloroflexota bacterium]